MFQEDDYGLVSAKAGDFIFIEDFWLNKQYDDTIKNHHGMWGGPRPYLVLATGNNRDKLFAVPLTSSISLVSDKIAELVVRDKCSREMPSALFCTTQYPDGGRHNGAIVLNCAVVVPSYSKFCRVPQSFVGAKLLEIMPPSGNDYKTKNALRTARENYNIALANSDYCPKSFDYSGVYRDLFKICQKLSERKAMATNILAYDRWCDKELEKIYRSFGR